VYDLSGRQAGRASRYPFQKLPYNSGYCAFMGSVELLTEEVS
jgi:hypothetical protein